VVERVIRFGAKLQLVFFPPKREVLRDCQIEVGKVRAAQNIAASDLLSGNRRECRLRRGRIGEQVDKAGGGVPVDVYVKSGRIAVEDRKCVGVKSPESTSSSREKTQIDRNA